VDRVFVPKSLEGKGPTYVFREAGIEMQPTNVRTIAELFAHRAGSKRRYRPFGFEVRTRSLIEVKSQLWHLRIDPNQNKADPMSNTCIQIRSSLSGAGA
jgi:hypothetical protein